MGASLLIGFLLGLGLTKLIEFIFSRLTRGWTTRFFVKGQNASSALLSLMHGVQDGAKFMGVMLVALWPFSSTAIGIGDAPWIIYVVGIVMLIGTLLGGYKVIKTMGSKMTKLEKHQAFATDLASVGGLMISTLMGWPVSTGQVKLASIMGAGASKGLNKVKWNLVGNILLTWLTTVPVCMAIAFLSSILTLAIMG